MIEFIENKNFGFVALWILISVLVFGSVGYYGYKNFLEPRVVSWLVGDITFPAGTGDVASCAEEAKLCPDGSYVFRTGPNCEFVACSTKALRLWSFEECVAAGYPTNDRTGNSARLCFAPDRVFAKGAPIDIAAWRAYKNEKHGFVFNYPPSWEVGSSGERRDGKLGVPLLSLELFSEAFPEFTPDELKALENSERPIGFERFPDMYLDVYQNNALIQQWVEDSTGATVSFNKWFKVITLPSGQTVYVGADPDNEGDEVILISHEGKIFKFAARCLFGNDCYVDAEVKTIIESLYTTDMPRVATGTSDWKTYRNEEYGFEVRYPKEGSDEEPEFTAGKSIKSYRFGLNDNPVYGVLVGPLLFVSIESAVLQEKIKESFQSARDSIANPRVVDGDYEGPGPIECEQDFVNTADGTRVEIIECNGEGGGFTEAFFENSLGNFYVEDLTGYGRGVMKNILSTFKFIP